MGGSLFCIKIKVIKKEIFISKVDIEFIIIIVERECSILEFIIEVIIVEVKFNSCLEIVFFSFLIKVRIVFFFKV